MRRGGDAFFGRNRESARSAMPLICWCAQGATVMFSEVTEVRDAIDLLAARSSL